MCGLEVHTAVRREEAGLDAPRFDSLSKALAQGSSRRQLVGLVAGVTLASSALVPGDTDAARRHRKSTGVGAETFHKRKATYCLNGETIRRYRRKQEKLLAMGATLGKCGDVPCVPTTCEALGYICGTAPDGCGGTLQCGQCQSLEATCCAGQCVFTEFDVNNCGSCGNVCGAGAICQGGRCGIP